MLVSEIDCNEIQRLLNAVPSGAECTKITFENGKYQLHLIASSQQIANFEYQKSLSLLQRLIANEVENDTKTISSKAESKKFCTNSKTGENP